MFWKKKNKNKPPVDPKVFKSLDAAIERLDEAVKELKKTRNNICG